MEFGGAGGMRAGAGRTTPSTPGRAAVRDERAAARRSLAVDGGTYYPAPLQLYHAPPLHDISLESFEELAVQRLKVGSRHRTYMKNDNCLREKFLQHPNLSF